MAFTEGRTEPSEPRWLATLGKNPSLMAGGTSEGSAPQSRGREACGDGRSVMEIASGGIGTGSGWRSPSVQPGSVYRWDVDGKVGAVPDRGGSSRVQDFSALGQDGWSRAGGWVPSSSSSSSSQASSSNSSGLSSLDPSQYDLNSSAFVCSSLSECEPCSPKARNHPFCRPYGNRRLVSCQTLKDPPGSQSPEESSVVGSSKPRPPADAEFVGWEACGKVVGNETKDYLEFVIILILLSLTGLTMLIRRNREMAVRMRTDPNFLQLNQSLADAVERNGSRFGDRRSRSTRSAKRAGARAASSRRTR